MKLKNLFFTFVSMAMIFFSACKSDDAVTGISLDQVSLSVAAGDSTTLKATIAPAKAVGTVTWTSSNAAIVTVKDGVVKGIAIGMANIVASVGSFTATCTVTVTEMTNFSHSLTGSEYYPIILDDLTATALGSKIKADFRPNGTTKNLYIWPDGSSYVAGTSTGPNFYGEVQGWVSLTVGSLGWSGAGFNIQTVGNEAALASLKVITDNPVGYYLHIGIKSKDNTVHAFFIGGQTDIKFSLGATGFVDGGATYPALGDFTRDGEWHEIEIPMTTLKTMGLSYGNFGTNPNVFSFLSGGTTGRTLDLDAVFIYKK